MKGIIKVIRAGKPAREKVRTERRRAEKETYGKRPIFRGQEEITSRRDQEGSKEWMGKRVGKELSENEERGSTSRKH